MAIKEAPVIPFEKTPTDTDSTPANGLLHPQGMSRASDILPLLPFGSTTLWQWSKDGRFPCPIRLSSTMTAWRNSDVLNWLEAQGGNDEIEGA